MRIDPRARRVRQRLIREVMALAGSRAELVHHIERGWASVTFAGTRHVPTLVFAGQEAVEDGERFIASLPEHEFAIPTQLVAEATVLAADHATLPEPRLTVEAALLLLEEG